LFGKKKSGENKFGALEEKTFFGKNFGKTILAGKKICLKQFFFPAKIFFPPKLGKKQNFWDKFFGKNKFGRKKFHRDRFSRLRET